VGATALALGSPALAGADTQITQDPSAANISSYGGAQAWQRAVPGTTTDFRLVIRRNGVVADAQNIDFFDHRVDPDVGPDEDNRIVVTYARCDNPSSYANPDCGLFVYDVKSRKERRVPGFLSDAEEYSPSTWGARYAYGRTSKYHVGTTGFPFELETNDPQTGSGAALFSNKQKLSSKPPLETDIYRNQILWTPELNRSGDFEVSLARTNREGSCQIDVSRNEFTPFNPVLDDRGNAYWLRLDDNVVRIQKRKTPDSECRNQGSRQSAPLPATSMAVDKTTIYYTDGTTGVKKADNPKPF